MILEKEENSIEGNSLFEMVAFDTFLIREMKVSPCVLKSVAVPDNQIIDIERERFEALKLTALKV